MWGLSQDGSAIVHSPVGLCQRAVSTGERLGSPLGGERLGLCGRHIGIIRPTSPGEQLARWAVEAPPQRGVPRREVASLCIVSLSLSLCPRSLSLSLLRSPRFRAIRLEYAASAWSVPLASALSELAPLAQTSRELAAREFTKSRRVVMCKGRCGESTCAPVQTSRSPFGTNVVDEDGAHPAEMFGSHICGEAWHKTSANILLCPRMRMLRRPAATDKGTFVARPLCVVAGQVPNFIGGFLITRWGTGPPRPRRAVFAIRGMQGGQ